MNDTARNNVFGILLKNLNLGKKTFKFDEIDSGSDDSVSTIDLFDVVHKMTEDKILQVCGDSQYEIIVDIGTFRNYILKRTEAERKAGVVSRKTPLDKIINSLWTAVKPDAQGIYGFAGSFNEGNGSDGNYCFNGKVYKNRQEYLEERRREIIRRMEEDIDDEDDGDGDDESDVDLTDIDNAIFARLDELAEQRRQEVMQSMNDEDGDSIINDYKDRNELYTNALKLCIKRGFASPSLLQKCFPIGYIKACKIIDWMENNNFVSPKIGSKPRKVLINKNDFEIKFGVFDDEKEEDSKESQIDSVSEGYLKRRANEHEMKDAAQNLVNALSRVAEKKSAPITCEFAPDWSLWNDKDFEEAVIERLERIIKSNRHMGRQGAIKKAETYLEAVRDTHDRKMVQVYERIVYEFKSASDYIYRQLKKQFFGEGE